MTLTEFLLARIAEDEVDVMDANDIYASGSIVAEEALARVLNEDRARAECEAKRRIATGDGGRIQVSGYLLGVLALPYADHPDYLDEWKP